MKNSLLFVVLTFAALSASATSNQNDLPVNSRSAKQTDIGPDSTASKQTLEDSVDTLYPSSNDDSCALFLAGDGSDEPSGFDVEF